MVWGIAKTFAFGLITLSLPVLAGQETAAVPSQPVGTDTRIVIPAGTPVFLRVESPVSSKTATRGDKFDLSLGEDIAINGQVVVIAGAKGKGEVIHVQKKGFGGRAGELLLAARYIDIDGKPLKLRGFAVSTAGENNAVQAIAIPVAGLFITGTSVEIKVGYTAKALTAENLEVSGASGR